MLGPFKANVGEAMAPREMTYKQYSYSTHSLIYLVIDQSATDARYHPFNFKYHHYASTLLPTHASFQNPVRILSKWCDKWWMNAQNLITKRVYFP